MSQLIEDYRDFMSRASGSPYVACRVVCDELDKSGFKRLYEKDEWNLEVGINYYVVRDSCSVLAFRYGKEATATSRMIVCGSHLDSPYLKLKPTSEKVVSKLSLSCCEVYGGGIWHTWFDRDLGISGRVLLKNGEEKCVSLKKPLARIPNLAIHLDTDRDYKINKETHLRAFVSSNDKKSDSSEQQILKQVAASLSIDVTDIIAHDLVLCDSAEPSFLGKDKEFLVGQGIDNLNGVFTSLKAFLTSTNETDLKVFAAFDAEEVGSTNRRGAHSVFLRDIITRVRATTFPDASSQTTDISNAKSIIFSVDGAHATHPNMSDLSEGSHLITLNGGVVLKQNVGQKYMSDGLLRQLVKKCADVNTQIFVLRQDKLGGSTIGPHIASFTGVRTVDLGVPMLSMHSIREMCGTKDVVDMVALLKGGYENFPDMSYL
ncbi:aspartyl aminopeptidase [Entamoeba marina]